MVTEGHIIILSKFRQPLYITYRLFASIYIFKYILDTVEHFFTGFKGFIRGLMSDGLNGNGGTFKW